MLVFMLHVVAGSYPVPVAEALKTMVGLGSGKFDFVVNTLRVPRALVAFLAGAGLALSGAILQGITRNPLAAPGVVGLNAGAALAAVAALTVFPALPVYWLPFAAWIGALAAALLAYSLAWRRGLSPVRLLLVGVGISAAAGAAITFLLTMGELNHVRKAVIWMTGSVYGRSWEHVWPLLPWLLALFPAAWLLSRQLDILQFGDELAKGLGSRLELVRALFLILSVSLAGASVAMAGTIGFVGLMAPHLARQLVGPAARSLLPAAALFGGFIVLLADWVGRTALEPVEIPCGILTALAGAPYMIYLLYTKHNK